MQEKRKGTFVCAGCGNPVYRSETKFDSGTGWPSFWNPVEKGIKQTRDGSIRFLPRTEVSRNLDLICFYPPPPPAPRPTTS